MQNEFATAELCTLFSCWPSFLAAEPAFDALDAYCVPCAARSACLAAWGRCTACSSQPATAPPATGIRRATARRRARGLRPHRARILQLVHAPRRLHRPRRPLLTQARLVRVNRITQDVEPWLAERWTASTTAGATRSRCAPASRSPTAIPFTADDVLFSFAAAYDPSGGSVDGATRCGRRPAARGRRAVDPATRRHHVSGAVRPGLRLLDNLPILPKHKLEAALRSGHVRRARGACRRRSSEIAGLGPFVLAEYVPGQRLVFTRNPHYLRKDADGTPLPYLDRIVVEIVPDQNAQSCCASRPGSPT